jgi:hypothetical protein
MSKISSWESYEKLDEEQYTDLISYSKELVSDNPNHKISFLIIAEGIEPKEKEAEAKDQEDTDKKLAIRGRSKNILNSIYGI